MKALLLLLSVFLIVSCSLPHYPSKQDHSGVLLKDTFSRFNLNTDTIHSCSIQYLGCASVIISYQGSKVLFDPFFSYSGFIKSTAGKIRHNEKAFARASYYVNRFGNSFREMDAVFISHAHFDHMLDLPFLLEKDSLRSDCKLYGNTSAETILKNFVTGKYSYNVLQAANPDSLRWNIVSEHMRVLPVLSSHAPHYHGVHSMTGESDSAYFKSFNQSGQLTKSNQWREGKVYGFVIDLLSGDTVQLRILIKGSGCELDDGKIPEYLLLQHPVDVVLMTVASSNYTNCYPQNLLKQCKPRHVILQHWEDFFRPYDSEKIKTVRATNFRYFFRQVEASRSEDWNFRELKERFLMPVPGTLIEYKF